MGGILFRIAVLCAVAGCSNSTAEPPGPRGLEREQPEAAFEGSLEHTAEQMAADDPRNRIRGALQQLGQDDEIPENASLEALQALIDDKVEKGHIPREHSKKLLKVLESADAHNKRLENLDQQLFGENAY